MATVLASGFESRVSLYSERLIVSSGLFYILTTHGRHLGAENVAEEVEVAKELGLTTTDLKKAIKMWEERTEHFYIVGYEPAINKYLENEK
ncbi:hypothetical protein ACWIT3_07910 [Pasteurella sp. P03HT]